MDDAMMAKRSNGFRIFNLTWKYHGEAYGLQRIMAQEEIDMVDGKVDAVRTLAMDDAAAACLCSVDEIEDLVVFEVSKSNHRMG